MSSESEVFVWKGIFGMISGHHLVRDWSGNSDRTFDNMKTSECDERGDPHSFFHIFGMRRILAVHTTRPLAEIDRKASKRLEVNSTVVQLFQSIQRPLFQCFPILSRRFSEEGEKLTVLKRTKKRKENIKKD